MMVFDYGLDENSHDYIERLSVRAIVRRKNKVLMVLTNQGDCMFPGGGIKGEETEEEALVREVREETGYTCNMIISSVCIANERKEDMYEPGSYIALVSKYFTCEVGSIADKQELDEYEEGLDFKAEWIDIEEAIKMNTKFRETLHKEDFWRLKTIEILKLIKA